VALKEYILAADDYRKALRFEPKNQVPFALAVFIAVWIVSSCPSCCGVARV